MSTTQRERAAFDSLIASLRANADQIETLLARHGSIGSDDLHLREIVAKVGDLRGSIDECERAELACRQLINERIASPAFKALGDAFREAMRAAHSAAMDPSSKESLLSPTPIAVSAGHAITNFDPEGFSVAEVLKLLGSQGKSGVLRVFTSTETIKVSLAGGKVVDATSTNGPSELRLGEILVRQGALERSALELFISRHRGDAIRLGSALVSEGLASQAALASAISHQMNHLFTRCLHSRPRSIEFDTREEITDPGDVRVSLSEFLIL